MGRGGLGSAYITMAVRMPATNGKKIEAVVGFPEKLPMKKPNYFHVDQGVVSSPTTVSLLLFCCASSGLTGGTPKYVVTWCGF